MLFELLQGCFKRLAFNSSAISQAYNNNDILLFQLQIWKLPQRIKCSDQFRVNKRDTDCFEHLHEEDTKPSVNVSVSHMPEFSYRHQDFYGFYRGELRSDGTLIEWERDFDVLVAISSPPSLPPPPPHFCREECC